MRYRLLYDHSDFLGETRAFDGIQLFLPYKLQQQVKRPSGETLLRARGMERGWARSEAPKRLVFFAKSLTTFFFLSANNPTVDAAHRWGSDYPDNPVSEIFRTRSMRSTLQYHIPKVSTSCR